MNKEKLQLEWETKHEKEICKIHDLEECFDWLRINIIDYKFFKESNEEAALFLSNHVGRWIRNVLGFWVDCNKPKEERSAFVKWFNEIGIDHPDDMSGIILTSWHRSMNGKDIKLEEQIKKYQDHWEKNTIQVPIRPYELYATYGNMKRTEKIKND